MFLVEGLKSIKEFITSNYQIDTIYYVSEQYQLLPKLPANITLFEVNNAELVKISTLQTPQGFLALVKMPETKPVNKTVLKNKFTLVLDGIQDPGNMGTIIRTADWFGFENIICSLDAVEAYNPKTVQATMGSLARVNIFYEDLSAFLSDINIPVFGALLDGESIYKTQWGQEGLVILGNEGKGISADVIEKINHPVTIPRVGSAESLNVAVSAAIFCTEIVRVRN